jgi:hypothetical protein
MLPSAVTHLLPTPTVSEANGPGLHGDGGQDLRTTVSLLPTPAVNDMGAGKTVEHWDEWTAAMQAKHGNGNGHGKSLAIEAQRLLPTPKATNNENNQSEGWDNLATALGLAHHIRTPSCGPIPLETNETQTTEPLLFDDEIWDT